MVFFTTILIVVILYYLQGDGLIYVTIIGLTGELLNIFMIHSLTKSVKRDGKVEARRVAEGFRHKLDTKKKAIQELEVIREDSVEKLYKANQTIAKLEGEIVALKKELEARTVEPPQEEDIEQTEAETEKKDQHPTLHDFFDDLPQGSQRKKIQL